MDDGRLKIRLSTKEVINYYNFPEFAGESAGVTHRGDPTAGALYFPLRGVNYMWGRGNQVTSP